MGITKTKAEQNKNVRDWESKGHQYEIQKDGKSWKGIREGQEYSLAKFAHLYVLAQSPDFVKAFFPNKEISPGKSWDIDKEFIINFFTNLLDGEFNEIEEIKKDDIKSSVKLVSIKKNMAEVFIDASGEIRVANGDKALQFGIKATVVVHLKAAAITKISGEVWGKQIDGDGEVDGEGSFAGEINFKKIK